MAGCKDDGKTRTFAQREQFVLFCGLVKNSGDMEESRTLLNIKQKWVIFLWL